MYGPSLDTGLVKRFGQLVTLIQMNTLMRLRRPATYPVHFPKLLHHSPCIAAWAH
jgi:hypothetical protein